MRPTFATQIPSRRAVLAAAMTIALTVLVASGCGGGSDVDIGSGAGGPEARVKWGKPAGTDPTGVVILLHGGGWQPNDFAYKAEMPLAATLQKRGFATVVIGYDAGAQGFDEVEQVYQQARERYPDLPICAHGISAGGTLALLLAAKEPDLTCVADLIGPTDLTTLKDQGGDEVNDLAVAAFGEDNLAAFSPALVADQIKAKVLIVLTETDPIIPVEQGPEFVQRRPATKFVLIPAGTEAVDWLHGAKVTPQGVEDAVNRPFDFIAQAIKTAQ